MMTVCPICGTRRVIYWPEHWVYRRGETYYCSENCMMVDQTRDMKLIHMIAHIRALKGSRSKMKQIMTYEQKKQAALIAIEGGNPLEYLATLGSSNPVKMWGHIRALMKEKEPEIFAKIPDGRETPKKAGKAPTVKLSGPLRIETPEANMVEVVETPEGSSGLFHDTKGEKTMKEEAVQPATLAGLEISALRHQDLGEFYFDKKYNCIDWRAPDGAEVSLGPVWWKQLLKDLPNIMKLLGVEV